MEELERWTAVWILLPAVDENAVTKGDRKGNKNSQLGDKAME